MKLVEVKLAGQKLAERKLAVSRVKAKDKMDTNPTLG